MDLEQTERLLLIVAKLFMLHFPLYQGPKQVGHRFEEVSAAEGTQLAVFCETQEHNDYPISLLRNVTLFCKSGGLQVRQIIFFEFYSFSDDFTLHLLSRRAWQLLSSSPPARFRLQWPTPSS